MFRVACQQVVVVWNQETGSVMAAFQKGVGVISLIPFSDWNSSGRPKADGSYGLMWNRLQLK